MKTDARVRYTKMRIREAFLQCLKEKPVSRITVKELCDLAEINRATFYTHYSDPFDLLEKLEAETLDKLRTMISERAFKGEDGLLLTLLRGMQGDKNDTGLLGSRNGDPQAALCPLSFPRPVVLRHIRAHGLHEGGGDQHDESANLLRNAYPGRGNESQGIDNGEDHEE